MRSLGCVLLLAACRPSTTTATAEPEAEDYVELERETISPHADIVAAIVPFTAGGDAIPIEDVGPAVDACRGAGWPETLPTAIASGLRTTPIGAHVQVVNRDGASDVAIDGIGCEAPGDIAGPIAWLLLATPAPEGTKDPRASVAIGGPPHLAIIGAKVSGLAKLQLPASPEGGAAERLRNGLVVAAAEVHADIVKRCVDTPVSSPSAEVQRAALAKVQLAALRDRGHTIAYAVLDDPALVPDCQGPLQVGVLFDEAGRVLAQHDSSSTIELQWVFDLDGDGTDETLVDQRWMEDGMHSILVVHTSGDAWATRTVWSADTP